MLPIADGCGLTRREHDGERISARRRRQWGALRFCAIWRAAPPDENNEI
jgi:hypothetical protein